LCGIGALEPEKEEHPTTPGPAECTNAPSWRFPGRRARRLFDTLADDTVASLRDRAILSVGLRRCVSNRAVYLIWPLRHDPANKTHHQTSID